MDDWGIFFFNASSIADRKEVLISGFAESPAKYTCGFGRIELTGLIS